MSRSRRIDGDFEALVAAVCGDFAKVAGEAPADTLLHADGSTLWVVFGKQGSFIANRFDTRDLIYKFLAYELAGDVQTQLAQAV